MNLISLNFQKLCLVAFMATGLCLGTGARGAIGIAVSPSPLITGQNFSLEVTAPNDVTQAIATVDFRPGDFRLLQIPLAKQGENWIGSGIVPPDLPFALPAGAMVRVMTINTARQRLETPLQVPVQINTISARWANGVLTVTGDDRDNTLVVSRDAAGNILVSVNGSPLAVAGGRATVGNTSLVRMLGLGSNDTLTVSEVNGALPAANLAGSEGDDVLISGSAADELDGGPGDDTLRAGGGNDRLFGGPGKDTLIGGTGVDEFFGGEGDDQIVWNPGDGSDVVEGEAGQDTMVFVGSNGSEIVDISALGQRLRFFRNPANILMNCDGIEDVIFRSAAGNDAVTVNDLTGTQVKHVAIDLFSNATNQTNVVVISGTDAADRIAVTTSTNGTDVTGLSAAVTITGAEKLVDALVIDARAGNDSVDFNGSDEPELVELFGVDGQLQFFSDVVGVAMGCDSAEQVSFHAFGGADRITVNDLTGTAVTHVAIDLAGNAPGSGDSEADSVVVNGSQTNDLIMVEGSANGMTVLGLTAAVTIAGTEPGLDTLAINALGGADFVDASTVQAGAMALTLNGGTGNDTLLGGQGNDLINGGQGADVMFGGAGDDTFPWLPGEGSDVIEGQAGRDAMLFVGANVAEMIDISANGSRLRFFRNIGGITMDCHETEVIQFQAAGGADTIFVNDLTGTGVLQVGLDLATPPGSDLGDNLADIITIAGTTNNDAVTITGSTAGLTVSGLSATVNIVGTDPTMDELILLMMHGDDLVTATGLPAGVIHLTLVGGPGGDVLTGSAGADVLLGDEDDDVLIGGPGFDFLDGGPGDNVLIQD